MRPWPVLKLLSQNLNGKHKDLRITDSDGADVGNQDLENAKICDILCTLICAWTDTSWETDSRSANHEISFLLWNRTFIMFARARHWCLSWGSWIYSTPWHPFILRSIVLPFASNSPKWALLFRLSDWNSLYILISTIHKTCPSNFVFFHLVILIAFNEEHKLWSSSLCIFLSTLLTSYILHPNIPSAPYSQTLSILSNPYCKRPSFTPI